MKSSSLAYNRRETRDKLPLGRDPDRSWCHHPTSVKLSWSQPMDSWTERQHTRMRPLMSIKSIKKYYKHNLKAKEKRKVKTTLEKDELHSDSGLLNLRNWRMTQWVGKNVRRYLRKVGLRNELSNS